MKRADWKTLLVFMLSPFFGGIVDAFLIMLFANHTNGNFRFSEVFMSALGMGVLAIVFYFIPAVAVGIIYLKTVKWNRFFQEIVCCAAGFIFSFLWSCLLFSASFSPTQDEHKFELCRQLGYTGMATALLVSIILNHKKKRKYRSS